MVGVYGKSKNTQTSKTTTVALPEIRDTFHSLKMVRKEKKKIIKEEKINK